MTALPPLCSSLELLTSVAASGAGRCPSSCEDYSSVQTDREGAPHLRGPIHRSESPFLGSLAQCLSTSSLLFTRGVALQLLPASSTSAAEGSSPRVCFLLSDEALPEESLGLAERQSSEEALSR